MLDSHGWDVAIEATDSLGRSAAQMHAQSGFTVEEQMLAQSLPDVDSYAGPQPRPSDAQAKHPTEVTGERTASLDAAISELVTVLVRSGWWYRQERTVEGLSAKQRVEWAQEDTVGGWDARRADLTELGNTERDRLGEDDEDRLRALQAAAAGEREPAGPVEVGGDVEIDEVHVDQLLPHAFLTRYVLPRRPVLIRGVTNNWVWADNWRKKAFIKRYGATERFNITVDVETDSAAGTARAQREVSLAEFVKKVSAANGGKGKKKGKKKQKARSAPAGSALPLPQRVRGKRATPWLINTRESALRDSRPFLKALDAIPKFQGWMDEAAQNGSTFYLPQAQEFSLGPGWAGLPPHVDGHAWSALAFGSRRWALWPPGAAGGAMELPRADGRWDWTGEILPQMLDLHGGSASAPEGNAAPFRVTVEAGDALYIPSGWVRGWVNLQESIGITDVFEPNWSEERASLLKADPLGKTLIHDMPLIDG